MKDAKVRALIAAAEARCEARCDEKLAAALGAIDAYKARASGERPEPSRPALTLHRGGKTA